MKLETHATFIRELTRISLQCKDWTVDRHCFFIKDIITESTHISNQGMLTLAAHLFITADKMSATDKMEIK